MNTQETHEDSVLFGQTFQKKIIEKITDKKTRNKMFRLFLINIVLFSFVYLAFVNFKKVNTEKMIDTKINAVKPIEVAPKVKYTPDRLVVENIDKSFENQSDTIKELKKSNTQLFNITLDNKKKKHIASIKIKNVYQVNSGNPEGFYIMVGSFVNIDNALQKQETNLTDFSCYIFYPKDNQNARVGLFVSENDKVKSLKLLKNIKKMQPDSWLLYNHEE